jgi:hypothetical protein
MSNRDYLDGSEEKLGGAMLSKKGFYEGAVGWIRSQEIMDFSNDKYFTYTTNNDAGLQHKRRLGAGSFGEVHEVSYSIAKEG